MPESFSVRPIRFLARIHISLLYCYVLYTAENFIRHTTVFLVSCLMSLRLSSRKTSGLRAVLVALSSACPRPSKYPQNPGIPYVALAFYR